ncbi:MAG TPA: ATP-binding protein [Thermogutta sp.]|nr:ATP-binding protein [Thermogutta sp.]
MQQRSFVNIFGLIFLPWAIGCLLASVVGYVGLTWQERSLKQAQAEEWERFISGLIEGEIGSQPKITDLQESRLLQSLIQNTRLELAVFTASGKYVVGSVTNPPPNIPSEVQMVLKTSQRFTTWTEKRGQGRPQLRMAWPRQVEGKTHIIWAAIDLGTVTGNGPSLRSLLAWNVVFFAIGLPFAWGLTWWLRRRLDVVTKSALEGEPSLRPWDLWEWHALAHRLRDYVAQQRQQIEVLQGIARDHQAVLEHLPDGLLFVTPAGRVAKHNPAAGQLLRFPGTLAEGLSIRECLRKPEFLTWVENLLSLKRPPVLSLHNDDPEQHLEIRGAELKGPDQRVHGFLLIIRDMTRTWAADRVRRDFVANVSHELRTPLTSIKGFLETLLDGALEDPPQANRFVRIIHEQTERLERIVNDLLILARLEGEHEQPITREPVRVEELVLGAVDACRYQAEQRGMQLHWEVPKDLTIRVNGRLFHQALVNLLDNAIKYSDPNKEIRILVRPGEKELIFEVQDQGWGIEARHLPRIFERFYRVDPSRSRQLGGTGLGLAIVKHVAQIHGGRVTVDSRVGVGTTFRIHLPVEHVLHERPTDRQSE